ncbi:tubulin polyglutamylase TTLL7 isoform X3 [Globicephala melas]|uniref:tubulin polyglutamylase TTLL7 isoform X3 n=1 Tax=Globicephala melas TaxID=9731 RepID=UPI00293D6F72|nr:tubulin polyglutamylase TTLL7 isoform X3 [Globicephala melas]
MPSLPQERVIQGPSPLDLNTELPYQSTMKRKVRKKKKKGTITANVAGTKFEIVRLVIDEMGFMKTPDEDETSNLIWCDSAVQQEKIAELRNYQRINHFPGMGEICRKDFLARNMTKMIKSRPLDYTFVPRTWIFPAEYTQFQNYMKELKKKRKQKTFIVKPANGAMGHGVLWGKKIFGNIAARISLIRNGDKLPSQDHLIVQEYIEKPFLMEGYKFDLRIYILVTSCDPLKIFLYHDGLVRMGTEKYIPPNETNLELVVKTLIVAEPHVLHAYRMCRPGQPPGSESVCFEVLGFDILLDRKLKPWLLEINRAPSFGTDQKIDYDVKRGVLLNALKLLNIRTSDKRRNLAKQKAEAQRRLYGQNSIKRLLPGSSDSEQQRHQLERRKEELKERLAQVRKQISKEEHENRHMGNYRRIYPPEDKTLLEKYENLLAVAFQTFLSGRAASFQREMNNPLKKMKEEDILDLLEQCEIDDEKLMGKTAKSRGPKPLSSMPESTEITKRQKYYSSDSSYGSSSSSSESEENEKEEYQNKKREKQVTYNLKQSNHYRLIQPSSSIRRSVSCPRSISSQSPSSADNRPFSAQQVISSSRSASGSRSHSLNRASSYVGHPPQRNDSSSTDSPMSESLRQLRPKEQEDDLTSQTLFVLKDMKIRFPGKSDAESLLLIEDMIDNWKYHKTKVASYWLIKLDSVKQRKVLDIVKTSVRTVLPRIWKVPDVEEVNLYRIFNRVFNRLLWSHGQGLWNCFCDSGSSWESIFSKSREVVTPLQLQCCQRLVELCKQCLLVVYKYATDSRGSLSGIGTNWGNSRYLLPGSTQFFMRTPTYNLKYSSPGMARSNVLFTSRYGHL